MRILFLTDDFSGASLCRRLAIEGHEVLAHVRNVAFRQTLDGMVEKIDSMIAGLEWVGHDGLIVCDDNGFGSLQDQLRGEGYSVVGGSGEGDRLEDDRLYGQRIFAGHGMMSIPTHVFSTHQEAIHFIEANPDQWVIKFNGHADKAACYVGQMLDGSDVIDVLQVAHGSRCSESSQSVVLQKRIHGVEIGCARYFNGQKWVGPIEFNIEHKRLFPGDLGPNTCEMGTLMWYDDDEGSRLFQETLAKLEPWLRCHNFRGDIDINCIVNEEGAWPLEATTRFGYPAVQAQMSLHKSPWGNFLKAVADGRDYDLQWQRGYAIVVLVAAPPFPCGVAQAVRPCGAGGGKHDGCGGITPRGLRIHFSESLSDEDWRHVHFESVMRDTNDEFRISDDTGYALHVTGNAETVKNAREEVYRRVGKIVIPRGFYRNDIGLLFEEVQAILEKQNWIV